MKLATYEDWKHCITVLCGIPLTTDYINQRLEELKNPSDYGAKKFIDTWGDAHLDRVIGWFEKAKREV